MVHTVMESIENSPKHIEYLIKVGIVEIYMERIQDLLDETNSNLKIRENAQKGIYIQDLTEKYIATSEDIFKIMKEGNSNRSVSMTLMNAESSRSHMIFMLTISQTNLEDLSVYLSNPFINLSRQKLGSYFSSTQLDQKKSKKLEQKGKYWKKPRR